MKILDILPKESIISDLRGRTKREVLEELTDALLKQKPQLNRARVVEVLLERERLGSTGIGDGIAIPHGKSRTLTSWLCRSAVPQPVWILNPWTENQRISSPAGCTGELRRDPFAGIGQIARLLKNSSVRKRLGVVQTQDEIYTILQEDEDDF